MRSVREPSAVASARPSTSSAVASVRAAGSPRATSMAKLGPDSTAPLACGMVSASTCPKSLPVACSRPLAHNTRGVPADTWAASAPATERTCWAGATIKMASWRAMCSRSVVASMPASSATFGRNARLVWRALISPTTSGSRAHKHTLRPVRHRVCASAVPQAPPPMTPRLVMVIWARLAHCRRTRPPLPSKHRFRTNAQRFDAGAAEQHGADAVVLGSPFPRLETLLDALGRAHQRRLVDEGIRHCPSSLLLASSEEGVLDLGGRRLKAQALDIVVVEILGACPHAADIEGHFRL